MPSRLLAWLLAGFIVQCANSDKTPCPKPCMCAPKKSIMICNGRGRNLTWIPKAPTYVKEFHLINADLQILTSAHIRNLTYCKLSSILLKDNNILSIQNTSLQPLKYLKGLTWNQKTLPLTDLESALRELKSPLLNLILQAHHVDTTMLNASSFEHLTNITLMRLNLGDIKTFNTGGLEHIVNLGTLDLRYNQLTEIHIDYVLPNLGRLSLQSNNILHMPSFCSKKRNAIPLLEYLDVSDNALRFLNTSGLHCLKNLTKLVLSKNRIVHFNTTGLEHIVNLHRLDIGDNQLTEIQIDHVLPNLRQLFLQSNNLWQMPFFCFGERNVIPRLQVLDVSDNAIRDVNTSGLHCLNGLEKLVLSQNRIASLKNNTFSGIKRLSVLYLQSLSSLNKVENLAFNSTSLKDIMFTMNPALNKKNSDLAALFLYTPNLKTLDLTNTKMKITDVVLSKFLLSLKNVEHLTMQRTGVTVLPAGVFSRLPKLSVLTLSGNYISYWDETVFANVTSIKDLTFDGCNIKTINETSFPLEFRLSVQKINLANNPFVCTCDLLWFRNWMKEVIANKSIEFVQYPHRYNCRAPNTAPLKLANYNPTASSCAKLNVYTLVITVVLGVSVTFLVVGLVIYRYRWYIFYWISLLRRRRQHRDPERELRYDAFVSYSNPDSDWMYEELLDFLEGEAGLTLCEHNRDFVPGKFIVDNVFDAMDFSRKTILVISNEYMKSHWCNFELEMAFEGFLKREVDIVVILKEHIQACNVTPTLRALLTSVVYIEWADEQEVRVLFRDRMTSALQH